jgi:hypothetical protein
MASQGDRVRAVATRRQRILAAFAGQVQPQPPVSMRMDLWHQDAVSRGTLPSVWAGLDWPGIEDRLGFCRAARYRARPRLVFPAGWVTETDDGEYHRTTYRLPGGVLHKAERRTVDQIRAGMRGAIVQYPVATQEDCRVFLRAVEQADLAADVAGFGEFDAATGEAGLPLLILGSCPAHLLMLEWFGYEQFYYALADYPDTLEQLIAAVERLFRTTLWPVALDSAAEVILHGNHFADATTPPPLFARYFLPYFQAFNAQVHAAGKRVVWHADAAMGQLLHMVVEAGFDGADCLATAPLVPERLADYDRVWRGRMVCWGGLPSTVFDPQVPEREFVTQLQELAEFTRDRAGFIIGASDNVMPGSCWERLVAVSEAFGCLSPAAA